MTIKIFKKIRKPEFIRKVMIYSDSQPGSRQLFIWDRALKEIYLGITKILNIQFRDYHIKKGKNH